MSVRARLSLLFAALTGSLMAVFCVALYAWVRNDLNLDLEHNLERQAHMLRERLLEEHEEVRRGIHADLAKEIRGYAQAAGIVLRIERTDGSLLLADAEFDPALGEDGSHEARVAGDPYRYRTDAAVAATGEGFQLTIGISARTYHAQRRSLRFYLTLFCPIALALSWLLGRFFVGRALSPVEDLRRRAEAISRENLSERVPEPAAAGEFRNLAHTFNDMLDRLDRAFQDLNNFAGDAAHELRTPVAILRAEIETAIQHRRSVEEYETILASLDEEVGRLHRVLANLFTLARIDSQQYAIQCEKVPLAPLLEEVRDTWALHAAARGIEIHVDADGAVAAADPEALRRIVLNLVENAIRYNRDGGRISLELEVATDPTRVRLRVEDTGIGIPPEHLPRLFRRFYRVDPARSRERGGAGLGLAICKSLVEAQAGTIEVASVPGQGSAFTIDLPAAEA